MHMITFNYGRSGCGIDIWTRTAAYLLMRTSGESHVGIGIIAIVYGRNTIYNAVYGCACLIRYAENHNRSHRQFSH